MSVGGFLLWMSRTPVTLLYMTWTVFKDITFDWGAWTFFEAMWISLFWSTRSRVLGRAVYWLPGIRRVRRRAHERRVDALLTELERQGVPESGRPNRGQLVQRWHRITVGRYASVPFLVGPVLVVVGPFLPLRPAPDGTTVTSLWMFAGLGAYGAVSIGLMAADELACLASDAAGLAATRAALFLEVLLLPSRGWAQGSALDTHGKAFRRLCHALRAQAKHSTRELSSTERERARRETERLIAVLAQHNENCLFAEGDERARVVQELAHLVSDALRHSSHPLEQRGSVVVVSAHLLVDAPLPGVTATAAADLPRNRLMRGAGWLGTALALFLGAVVLPGGGAATDVLVVAGLLSIAIVCPPLREVLGRAMAGSSGAALPGGEPRTAPGAEHPLPQDSASPPSAPPCPGCAGHSPMAAGARPG
ncbi:hypothetical protein GCM10010336_12480 [Streptomyces goshikiensis]|nr:hypothetical protein GCM10010336_12480 [Streptomyces goshikiensis]